MKFCLNPIPHSHLEVAGGARVQAIYPWMTLSKSFPWEREAWTLILKAPPSTDLVSAPVTSSVNAYGDWPYDGLSESSEQRVGSGSAWDPHFTPAWP